MQEAAAPLDGDTDGRLESFLGARPLLDLSQSSGCDGEQAVVYAPDLLQDEPDYRGTLQRWLASAAVGGMLVVTVPHAFLDTRQDKLPVTHRPRQKRLYTPASLLAEIEEALPPNSYRLRWLADRDAGYDYALDRATPPVGQHDIAVALERIAPPAWDIGASEPPAGRPPDFTFEPLRTRMETMAVATVQRILLLKLDHLGDFVMGVPALRAIRRHFPDAHITLVVGTWNAGLAAGIGIADNVLIFDVFPRNASDLPADIAGKAAQFEALVEGRYDLAIDLRSFSDTRILLRGVDAAHKAGLGHGGVHPFLDIFLPIDPAGDQVDHAWTHDVGIAEFYGSGSCVSSRFQIGCDGVPPRDPPEALMWGPYRPIVPGDYQFRPAIDADFTQPGLLAYDIAIDTHRVAYGVFDGDTDIAIPFTVADKVGLFEFRLWTIAGEAAPAFRFYGGRLSKQGAGGMLHQSEYLALLVELTAMRLASGPRFPAPDA